MCMWWFQVKKHLQDALRQAECLQWPNGTTVHTGERMADDRVRFSELVEDELLVYSTFHFDRSEQQLKRKKGQTGKRAEQEMRTNSHTERKKTEANGRDSNIGDTVQDTTRAQLDTNHREQQIQARLTLHLPDNGTQAQGEERTKQGTYVSVHQLAVVVHLVGAVLVGDVSLLGVHVDARGKFLPLVEKRTSQTTAATRTMRLDGGGIVASGRLGTATVCNHPV